MTRRESRGRRFLRRSDFAHFFSGYDPKRASWKRDWRGILAGHSFTRRFHAMGWLLERVFGSGAEKRDGRAVVRG